MNKINKFVESYYNNGYNFDDKKFAIIIKTLYKMIEKNPTENKKLLLGIENMLNKYDQKDYFYTIEILKYNILPLIKEI